MLKPAWLRHMACPEAQKGSEYFKIETQEERDEIFTQSNQAHSHFSRDVGARIECRPAVKM
jgi:hypothetical protein